MIYSRTCHHQPEQLVPSQLLLPTDTNYFGTKQETSSAFLSFVNFVKEGNTPDETTTNEACLLLSAITPGSDTLWTSVECFHELIPSGNDPCRGFLEAIVALLTCKNQKVVLSTLKLVSESVKWSPRIVRFELIESGLFTQLPRSFWLQELHLKPLPNLFIASTINRCLFCSTTFCVKDISKKREITPDQIRETIFTNVVEPLEEFYEYYSFHRHEMRDDHSSFHFVRLLETLVRIAAFHEQTTNFVISSSICLAFTSCLSFFTTITLQEGFLEKLRFWIKEQEEGEELVKLRGRRVMGKLNEEGLFDLLLLFIRLEEYDNDVHQHVLTAGRVIQLLGGNNDYFA